MTWKPSGDPVALGRELAKKNDVKSRTDTYISYSLIGMASFLLIVICYLAVFATESQSIQLLTGLFGILVGYLVGNRSNAERVAHL